MGNKWVKQAARSYRAFYDPAQTFLSEFDGQVELYPDNDD